MAIGVCPPGTGPSLHAHQQTYETFTVLKGRFEFTWGGSGEHSVVLEPFDTMSVPPCIHRAFKNVSDEEGALQVVITGGLHDRYDIQFARSTTEQLRAKGEQYLDYFKEKVGLQFE